MSKNTDFLELGPNTYKNMVRIRIGIKIEQKEVERAKKELTRTCHRPTHLGGFKSQISRASAMRGQKSAVASHRLGFGWQFRLDGGSASSLCRGSVLEFVGWVRLSRKGRSCIAPCGVRIVIPPKTWLLSLYGPYTFLLSPADTWLVGKTLSLSWRNVKFNFQLELCHNYHVRTFPMNRASMDHEFNYSI